MNKRLSRLERTRNIIRYYLYRHSYGALQRLSIEDGIARGIDVSRYMYPWLHYKDMDIIKSKLLDQTCEDKKVSIAIKFGNVYDDTDNFINIKKEMMGGLFYTKKDYRYIADRYHFEVNDYGTECNILIDIDMKGA